MTTAQASLISRVAGDSTSEELEFHSLTDIDELMFEIYAEVWIVEGTSVHLVAANQIARNHFFVELTHITS